MSNPNPQRLTPEELNEIRKRRRAMSYENALALFEHIAALEAQFAEAQDTLRGIVKTCECVDEHNWRDAISHIHALAEAEVEEANG